MPLYDLEMGGKLVDPKSFYNKFIKTVANQIDPHEFNEMCRTFDIQLAGEKPSQKSQLVWTRLAKLVGYDSEDPSGSKEHIWEHAMVAVKGHGEQCNLFVGALMMWRISLIDTETWLIQKTHDAGAIHPYRGYWVNNNFVKHFTMKDLQGKFQSSYV